MLALILGILVQGCIKILSTSRCLKQHTEANLVKKSTKKVFGFGFFFFFKPRLKFLIKFQISGRKCSSAITIYFSPVCLLSAEDRTSKGINFIGTKVHGNAGDFCQHFYIGHVLLFQSGLHEATDLFVKFQVVPVHLTCRQTSFLKNAA